MYCLLNRNGDLSMRRRRVERRGQLSLWRSELRAERASRSWWREGPGSLGSSLLSGRRSRGWLAGEWPGRPPFLAKRPSRSHSSRSVLNVAPNRTINALWQLHPGNDRHEFFRAAQDKILMVGEIQGHR